MKMDIIARAIVGALLFLFGAAIAEADTLRVATYNALNLSGTSIIGREDAFRTVLGTIDPDMIAFQEVLDEEGVDQLLSSVLLPIQDDWTSVAYNNDSYNDNAFFYRTTKVQLVSTRYIPTELRYIVEYTLRPAAGDTTLRVRIYSLHLKANSGSGDNVDRRRQEARSLRQQLNQIPAGSSLMVCGDYNLLSSDEPAYQILLADTPSVNGQLNDPINSPGQWDGNAAFAAVHTIGTDDMNARFDFILVSNALMDTVGSYVLPATYHAFGNDGRHFGRAVSALPNYAVPDSVAYALYAASDHLPVVTDFILNSEATSLTERTSLDVSYALMACYPNPFNPTTTIAYNLSKAGYVSLRVFDLLGREVAVLNKGFVPAGSYCAGFDGRGLGSGIYFARLDAGKSSQTTKLMLLK
jgi:endonuclease/exonuclease/phosphatase family metal-dependent hydrolase